MKNKTPRKRFFNLYSTIHTSAKYIIMFSCLRRRCKKALDFLKSFECRCFVSVGSNESIFLFISFHIVNMKLWFMHIPSILYVFDIKMNHIYRYFWKAAFFLLFHKVTFAISTTNAIHHSIDSLFSQWHAWNAKRTFLVFAPFVWTLLL